MVRPTHSASRPPTQAGARPRVLYLFSGDPTLAHTPSIPAALDAAGVDCDCFDTLVGGAAHHLGDPAVQGDILGRMRRLEYAAVILATPCGPVSILRDDASAPPLFDRSGPIEPCPPGWETYRAEYLQLVDFSCVVIELADALGIHWLLENPADVAAPGPARWRAKAHLGSFWVHERVLRMRALVVACLATFAQCAFGCRFRKWTCIAYSSSLGPAFDGWRRLECVHGFAGHPEVAAGWDALGHPRSRAAAAYPGRMNGGIAQGVARAILDRRATAESAASPLLSPAMWAACDHACAQPPRFSSYRNRRPASDAELRAAAFPVLAPPSPPVPRRLAEPAGTNPWPPGAWERRPIAIEDLHLPGVYAAFEAWLLAGEAELQAAAAAAELSPGLRGWQQACARRLAERCESGARPHRRSYTITNDQMAPFARATLWDTTDRDNCTPLGASTAATVFPGELQLDRHHLREILASMGWDDLDLDDQLGSGLEARTGCPRDTVVSLHHPGIYTHFAAAAEVIAGDVSKQWVRAPPPRQGGRPPHPPSIPCKSDPRDVVLRLVTRVSRDAGGAPVLTDATKARVSSNLSFGGDASVNAGVPGEQKSVWLPSVQQFGRSTAMAQAAFSHPTLGARERPSELSAAKRPRLAPPAAAASIAAAELPRPPSGVAPRVRPRVGMYALDLSSAYRYVCLQLLDLWCHTFVWLDESGRLGIFTDTRLCFGGAYGPNRFERVTTLIAAWIQREQAAFNASRPFPAPVLEWQRARERQQQLGLLPAGPEQLTPDSIQVFLDDFNGCGGLDAVAPPAGIALIEWDAAHMAAVGLEPAESDSRLVALASIAAHSLTRLQLSVAADKTMAGSSIISLGAQPDVAAGTISCPEAKREILMAHSRDIGRDVAEGRGVDRAHVERWTGRLNNQAQFFPELGPELHAGYAIAYARERSGRRRLLSHVPVAAASDVGAAIRRLAAIAVDVFDGNEGVPLAAAERFPAPGSSGVATVVSDASGDVYKGDAGVGGYSFLPSYPRRAYVVSERWPLDIAMALAEGALEPRERSGAPQLSMPAAELFTSWACACAAVEAAGEGAGVEAVVAVGDCQPAAAALNRASSPVLQMRLLLRSARADSTQWLGVQVPRELNTQADILSHPSRRAEVMLWLRESGYKPELVPVPQRCWRELRAAIAAAPAAGDFD